MAFVRDVSKTRKSRVLIQQAYSAHSAEIGKMQYFFEVRLLPRSVTTINHIFTLKNLPFSPF